MGDRHPNMGTWLMCQANNIHVPGLVALGQGNVIRGKRVHSSLQMCTAAYRCAQHTHTHRSGTAAHRNVPAPSLPAARGHSPFPAELTLVIAKPLKLPAPNPHKPRTASRSARCCCSDSPSLATELHLPLATLTRTLLVTLPQPHITQKASNKRLCRRCSRNASWS